MSYTELVKASKAVQDTKDKLALKRLFLNFKRAFEKYVKNNPEEGCHWVMGSDGKIYSCPDQNGE
jgi:hypothetical protein